jgi:hypothetical protein
MFESTSARHDRRRTDQTSTATSSPQNRGHNRRRRSRTATAASTIAVVILCLSGAVGFAEGGPAVASAAAAGASSCSFANAGSGTYARTLCWFDLSTYNAAAAGSAAGQPMSVALPGGYSISFTLKVSGGPVKATSFPTYSGAYLGNGAYTGVSGKPALYQTQSGTTTTATLSGIAVVDSKGNPVSGYAFVGADAESTDATESITWSSDANLDLISNVGNACKSGALLTGVGTTTVKCSATASMAKTGTPILAAVHPSTFSQTMVGQGLQAVAFGVLVSTVQLNKTVSGRINPSDAFAVNVSSSTGSVLGSANTGATNSASTGQITVLTSSAGQDYTLSESATSGLESNYNPSWSCTRNGTADPSLPSGPAPTSTVATLGIGDFVNCTITNTAKSTSLSLLKQAAPPTDVNADGIPDAGHTIAYTFIVTNTGMAPMSSISVTDPRLGPVTCPQPTLAPAQSETCTGGSPYTITSADEAAGTVVNTATASGLPPGGATAVQSNSSSATTAVQTPSPAVSMVKTANAAGGDTSAVTLGEKIAYSYLVTNTGNVNLTSLTVSDPSEGSPVTCPTPPAPGLAPGDSETCTAETPYTVTQADVDNGKAVDTATATGTDPSGDTSDASAPSTVTVPSAPAPRVAIDKHAQVTPAADQDAAKAGDTVAYTYTVTNTGNVTLATVTVDDPTLGLVTCPAPAAPGLAPGASETCTGDTTYTVSQADVDQGTVTDTVTATGTDTNGNSSPISEPSTATVDTVEAAPAVSIDTTATVTPSSDQDAAKLGDTITYDYLITNTGDTTLTSAAVDDPTLGPATCPTPPAPGLAPGASESCTGDNTYTVSEADIDNGKITDTASATGTDTLGTSSPPSEPSTATTFTANPDPATAPAQSGASGSDATGPTAAPSDGQTAAVPPANSSATGATTPTATNTPDDAPAESTTNGATTDPEAADPSVGSRALAAGTHETNVDAPAASPESATEGATTQLTRTTTAIASTTATASTGSTKAKNAPSAANGLGKISTDLGRWIPSSGHNPWLLVAAIALAFTGIGLLQTLRRRPDDARDQEPNHAS